MTPGMKIKLERIKRHKKQYEFAVEIGISKEYLRQLENDKAKNPSIEIMKKIAHNLELSVGDLWFNEE